MDEIWCVSVNDPFVMVPGGRDLGSAGKVRMMGDGSAEWTKALGLEMDLTTRGMGCAFATLLDAGEGRHREVTQSGSARQV